ncbi:hypothetical protein [Halorubrum miltondacostae]|uniref:Uncharacterized protein n=1 Tax=Halorubrum miltondacostae TaxID=3076378 RepID=A0ABD5MA38_9EURY
MSEVAAATTIEFTQATIQQLRQRCDDQESVDDLISNLLDETRNSVTLKEFIDLLGEEVDPVQIALYEDVSSLLFTVNATSTGEELEAAVEEIDAVEIDGAQFSFDVKDDPGAPQDLGRLSLYTTVELTEINDGATQDSVKKPVSREEGVKKVEEWVRSNKELKPL